MKMTKGQENRTFDINLIINGGIMFYILMNFTYVFSIWTYIYVCFKNFNNFFLILFLSLIFVSLILTGTYTGNYKSFPKPIKFLSNLDAIIKAVTIFIIFELNRYRGGF